METAVKYDIKETTWPEKSFVIKRGKIAFDKLSAFFGESYGTIYSALQKKGITPTEMPCAFYYTIDEQSMETELAAAVPVPSNADIPELEKVTLPSSKIITTTHIGPYDSMKPAYDAMEAYLEKHGLTRLLMIEEYFSDPVVEKDPGKWKTDIHFVVK